MEGVCRTTIRDTSEVIVAWFGTHRAVEAVQHVVRHGDDSGSLLLRPLSSMSVSHFP